MSTELDTPMAGEDTARAESGLLVRSFAAEVTSGEGRTVDVRIIPYGEQIEHNDGYGGVPRGVVYREEWIPGVFSGQERAANRVLVNVEHEKGIGGVVGHGVMLREDSSGFYGSFKLHETPDGDKALLLVREGVLSTVSVEAIEQKSVRTKTGVVQRVKAHLRGVALTRFGAFEGAVVLALREKAHIIDEALLPVDMDPDLVERCRQAGAKLPQRYEAHPGENGHPGESGTPEDGTRPDGDTPTSLEV